MVKPLWVSLSNFKSVYKLLGSVAIYKQKIDSHSRRILITCTRNIDGEPGVMTFEKYDAEIYTESVVRVEIKEGSRKVHTSKVKGTVNYNK